MSLNLPIQAAVDRTVSLHYRTIDQKVLNKNNQLIQIVRSPVDGPYGSDPGDPAWFPPQVNSRSAACQILSSYAVARCLRGGGYF